MGREKSYFLIGGIAALLFYIALLLALILFFNDYKRSKRYVPKKSYNIEVAILQQSSKKERPKPKKVVKKEVKRESLKSPVVKNVSQSAPKESVPVSTKAISSLFEAIKADKPAEERLAARLANAPKIKYKAVSESRKKQERASTLVRDINLSKPEIDITSKSSGVGEVDKYMSRLYDIIYKSWHPEAIYAGEEAKVRLFIAPDGTFDYKLLYPSDNQGFNQSLIEYLDRMKAEKLPPHQLEKRLDVDIEFKAKE